MPEHPTDAHFSFSFVFKQALKVHIDLTKKQIWKIRAKYYYGNKDRCKAIAEMKRISKLTNSNVDIPTSKQP